MKKFYTIPIFIPEKACPFRCIYCNQYTITNKIKSPTVQEVKQIIDTYLNTFPTQGIKKLGFFGGSFTGMSIDEQNKYLDVALPYIENGEIESLMLSTRPDYISEEILDNLKKYKVETIELGAQSLDDDVLSKSKRGHTAKDVEKAAKMILKSGFKLGLQMMIGLPGDSFEKSMKTAHEIIKLGASVTRIYPTLVIKDTPLELMCKSGEYAPLSLEQAVDWSKHLLKLFEENNVTILRMGLHPSEGLIDGSSLVAGPFHVSFKELVMTSLWKDLLESKLEKLVGKKLVIEVPPRAINAAIGYNSANKKELLKKFNSVSFKANGKLADYEFNIDVEA